MFFVFVCNFITLPPPQDNNLVILVSNVFRGGGMECGGFKKL